MSYAVVCGIVMTLSLAGLGVWWYLTQKADKGDAALAKRGRDIRALLLTSDYVTSASGMRTRMVTYEFEAQDPKTGALAKFTKSITVPPGTNLPYETGEPLMVRYLPDDPSVNGVPGKETDVLRRLAFVGLAGLALFTGWEMIQALRGNR